MRIASWNINSVRLRLDLVARFLDEAAPDVLCLQETKTVDDSFPKKALAERGYRHQWIAGMKGYNGVAIVSRLPLRNGAVHSWCGRQDCRHISATLADGPLEGTEVHCLYIPAGGDIPDPAVNDKFAHKLAFLEAQTQWWQETRQAEKPILLLGDFNIAPLENDVWSHRQMLGVVSHTPQEVAQLNTLQHSLGWIDTARQFVPPAEKLYTWWSYRASDWAASNRGRRLDHIWATPALAPRLTGFSVLGEARGWPRPSDHVPVMLDLA